MNLKVSLKSKMLLAFGGITLLLLVVGAINLLALKRIVRDLEHVADVNLGNISSLAAMRSAAQDMNVVIIRLQVEDDTPDERKALYDRFESDYASYLRSDQIYRTIPFVPGERERYERMDALFKRAVAAARQLVALSKSGASPADITHAARKMARAPAIAYKNAILDLIAFQDGESRKWTEMAKSTVASSAILGFAVVLGGATCTLAFGVLLLGQLRMLEKSESGLKASRSVLELVFNTVPHALFLKDQDQRILLANRAAAEFLQMPAEQLIGRKMTDIPAVNAALESNWNRAMESDLKAISSGKPVEYEEELNLPAGRRHFCVIKVPIPAPEKGAVSLFVLRQDVTDKRAREEELKRSRALLQSVFDTIPHHLFVKDNQGRFVMVNRAMAQAFSRKPADYVGLKHVDSGQPGHEEAIEKEDRTVLEEGTSTSRNLARTMPNGQLHHFSLIKTPMRDEHGCIIGMVGLAQDITAKVHAEQARIELERQLHHAHRLELIGQLSAGVSHDFNNLLTPIFGHAELLLSESALPETARASAGVILSAAQRASELTQGLLAFGRKQVLDRKELCLNDAVRVLEPILARLIGKSIAVQLDLAPDLGWVLADSSQVQQVLLNLAVNARDAMPNGGVLMIGTQNETLDKAFSESNPGISPGPYVMLYVGDTGHGMDAETLRRVFEPFFTTKAPGKGTGLGLSIVHGIVEQHGGLIRPYSTPGLGTTFRIFLPRIEPDPAIHPAGLEPTPIPLPSGHERILVVDDEEMIRKLVCTVLESHGYAVTEAINPEQALDLVNRANPPYSALVTDLVMPGMSGLALYQRAAARQPRLRVLYISGHPKHLAEELGFRGMGQHFLSKPFPNERMLRAVRELLDA